MFNKALLNILLSELWLIDNGVLIFSYRDNPNLRLVFVNLVILLFERGE